MKGEQGLGVGLVAGDRVKEGEECKASIEGNREGKSHQERKGRRDWDGTRTKERASDKLLVST